MSSLLVCLIVSKYLIQDGKQLATSFFLLLVDLSLKSSNDKELGIKVKCPDNQLKKMVNSNGQYK